MSFGDGNLRERAAELENELEGLREDWGCDLVRIEELESLVADLWPRAEFTMNEANRADYRGRMDALELMEGGGDS